MFQKKVHYVSQLGSMDCGIAWGGITDEEERDSYWGERTD